MLRENFMPKIYFEHDDGLLMIDGLLFDAPCLHAQDNASYALIYSSSEDFLPLMLKLTITNGKVLPCNHTITTDCGNGIYSIKFCCLSYSSLRPPKPYFQSYINADRSHYLTAYEQGNYHIAIETDSEIITLDCPAKLIEIKLKALNCSQGNLLIVSGQYGEKKYLAIIKYTDDYELIFQADCHDFNFYADKLVIIDRIDDMLGRTVIRDFSYTQGKYCELTRRFEYSRSPYICDELLPYALIEALRCNDHSCCDNYLSYSLRQRDMHKFFDGHYSIWSKPYINYQPFRIGTCNNCGNHNRLRYFDFTIENHQIIDISPI